MNVVGVVLRVVVFHEKRRPLHAVVMAFLRLDASRPGERKVLRSGPLDSLQVLVRDLGAIPIHVFPDDLPQQFGLRLIQFRRGNSRRSQGPGFAVVASDDLARRGIRVDRDFLLLLG